MRTERLATASATTVLPLPAELERIAAADAAFEFRTYDYTRGWDEEDADLGWVDADVVRGSRRLH